jgi:hypothetical protein
MNFILEVLGPLTFSILSVAVFCSPLFLHMSMEAENDGNEGVETEHNAGYRYFCISIIYYSVLYCADKQDLKV